MTDVTVTPPAYNERMRFSASRLKVWMNCPLQATFKYDQHLPELNSGKTVFGSCIHQALEHYNQHGDVDKAIKEFRKIWADPSLIGRTIDYWPRYTTFEGLRTRGVEVLRTYDASLKWDAREVIATEHKFLVPFGKYELTGFVDLLELRKSGKGKNTLRIIDFKSSSRKPTLAQLYTDIQFSTYLYASMQPEFWKGNGVDFPPIANGDWWYETMKDMPRRAIWWHLWDNKEMDAGARDDADFMRLYRVCEQIERATQLQVFVPKIGEACTFCPYTEPCGITIPTQEEVREDQEAWI